MVVDHEYTHLSVAHGSLSRINYFLCTKGALPFTSETRISDIAIVDHPQNHCHCGETGKELPRRCGGSLTFWQGMRKKIHNGAHMSDIILFWDAGKAVLRGRIIAVTAAIKKV